MSLIAWSHYLCSRRMSKYSLANTDSNPLTQSSGVKGVLCASEVRWAPSVSFWEVVEVADTSSIVDSKRILVTKNLFSCLYSTSQVRIGASSSSESSAYYGGGPD